MNRKHFSWGSLFVLFKKPIETYCFSMGACKFSDFLEQNSIDSNAFLEKT
jgi:hypothetical protein